MPLPITFDWTEDEQTLNFVLHVKGAKAKNVDIAICDVYVKVNCHPQLFDADLLKEVDPDDAKTRCKVGGGKVTLTLKKKEPGLWYDFRAKGSKAELRERRRQALQDAEEREQERQKRKEDWKQEMLSAGEKEQWRLDRENRDQIEKWEQEEKRKWEEDMYAAFDEESGKALEDADLSRMDGDLDAPDDDEGFDAKRGRRDREVKPQVNPQEAEPDEEDEEPRVCEVTDEEAERIRREAAAPAKTPAAPIVKPGTAQDSIWSNKDLDDTEEYVPEIRTNPIGKVGLTFTERPRAGIPVRDRGNILAPPHPKGQVKSELPPMMEGDQRDDESDPVWLKDKADNLMVAGDYQGAHNAYTAALKLGTNARAFANRAVASMYVGNLEQCIEDCGHAVRILDTRHKAPAGHMPGPVDPQDQQVRVKVEVRMGTAYLWLGAFGKAEEHYAKALEVEDGWPILEDRRMVQADLDKIKESRAALVLKEKADTVMRRSHGGGEQEKAAVEAALGLYDEAANLTSDVACVRANRCFARLRAGQLGDSITDADAALDCLKRWPVAMRAPKKPARPTRLDPPYLDDPTFTHPDEQKQGEVDWLMKHGGGTGADLPTLPPEYEWVKDAAEKREDAWIAIRKKMSRQAIETVKRNTTQIQDVVYTRNPRLIRQQLPISIDTNRVGEGPSDKAIRQASEYAEKLEAYEKEQDAEREQERLERQQEFDEADLERAFAPVKSGVGQLGFGRAHPVEKTRRRLYVKTLLRRARAFELKGSYEACVAELRTVLRAEPDNPEAKQRLSVLATPVAPDPAPEKPAPPPKTAWHGGVLPEAAQPAAAVASNVEASSPTTPAVSSSAPAPSAAPSKKKAKDSRVLDDDDDDEEAAGTDHAATSALINSAAEYMRKNDYGSALQIYGYARRQTKVWESPMVELKVLSNTCLCLQRLRGRLPDLVSACDEVMDRIDKIRCDANLCGIDEEKLLHMECACLSRRGSALAQLQRQEESSADAARVKELMALARELEAKKN
eukprot:TRINITY_DN11125_c0_g1_i2.p1 TRINITY_DN11125_c0_g1~~TRINITY_DN11125_c0_g1_i2.p1  ORF type:complete len:1046 (-),score=326.37 TRINITY_DN11125_c0_g1_i2:264-3302(-)